MKPVKTYSGSGFSLVPPAFESFLCFDTVELKDARINVVIIISSSHFADLHVDFICAAPLKRSCKSGKVYLTINMNVPYISTKC